MTTTKTPEQSEREQLDILNELADVRARLSDAERAKGEAVVAERERVVELAARRADEGYRHGESCDDIARDIRALAATAEPDVEGSER